MDGWTDGRTDGRRDGRTRVCQYTHHSASGVIKIELAFPSPPPEDVLSYMKRKKMNRHIQSVNIYL